MDMLQHALNATWMGLDCVGHQSVVKLLSPHKTNDALCDKYTFPYWTLVSVQVIQKHKFVLLIGGWPTNKFDTSWVERED